MRHIRKLIAFLLILSLGLTALAQVTPIEDPYDILVLVNRDHALSRDFRPHDLVPVGNGHSLREQAAQAFLQMHSSMNQAGLFLTVRSGFRDYETQRQLFNRAVNNWGLATAERWVARPGHSEHQTGLAVDIVQRGFTGSPLSSARFQNTQQFAWLMRYAHTYGFILRYLQEYEHITGIAFEPWHWRYIGVESATYMRENGFTLFETYIEHRAARAADKIPSDWAKEQVNAAIDRGLVPQQLQTSYRGAISRAEFTALAVALYENKRGAITGRVTFADTDDVNVQKAAYIGIVTGVGGNRFAPDDKLTREQAAVILFRLGNALGQALTGQSPGFADRADISSWAMGSVGGVQAAGIMGGVGDDTFAPQDSFTREQAIVTMMRLFDLLEPSLDPAIRILHHAPSPV